MMGGAEMKHLGDITEINGAEIEIVDVITGGSPCQDLSIAGKRAGLAGAEKYSLSAKACQGILRRAERRGKDLPELLKTVLLMQSESGGAVTEEEKAL